MYNEPSQVTLRGPLPDLFRMRDGSRMTKAAQWPEQRAYLLETSVPLGFGHMPPKPEVFRLQHLYSNTWAVTVGSRSGTSNRFPFLAFSQMLTVCVQYEPVEVVEDISGGERGTDGFGSTGRF